MTASGSNSIDLTGSDSSELENTMTNALIQLRTLFGQRRGRKTAKISLAPIEHNAPTPVSIIFGIMV